MTVGKVFLALVWKDLRAEMQGGRLVISSLALGVLLILVVGMALDATGNFPAAWSSGLLWMILFFTTSLSMSRHDVKEQEFGGWMGALLAPIDRSLVFYAKWFATWLLVVVATCGMVVAFFIILNVPAPVRWGEFCWVIAVGTFGLSGAGTFLATLAGHSNLREVLVPLLLFPISIPLFLALTRLTLQSLDPLAAASFVWIEILLAYIVIVGILPWLLYELMMEV